MLSLTIDNLFIPDLKDDFIMNKDKKLYDFIEGDPITAFYLGMYITNWWEFLDKEQQYLHSKLLRHNGPDIVNYQSQIAHWSKNFEPDGTKEIDMFQLAEFILNNVIFEKEEDIIKLALHLGMVVGQKIDSDGTEYNGEFGIK